MVTTRHLADFSQRPFLAGFGPLFLLWETSTPFLNIHWFMVRSPPFLTHRPADDMQDKLALSDVYPTFHLFNAIVFMLVFFLARIVYGGYQVRRQVRPLTE